METPLRSFLVPYQRLVTLNGEMTVEEALKELTNHNLISAPVIQNGKPIGFIDVLDFLAFLAKEVTKPLFSTSEGYSRYLDSSNMAVLKKRAKDFKLGHLIDVVNLSKRNPFHFLNESSTLKDAIQLFKEGVHRIAVKKDEPGSENLLGVVTQSTVVEFIVKNLALFPELSREDLKMNNFMNKTENIAGTLQDVRAIDAFIRLYEENLSSLAIINDRSSLVGTLSASDLRRLAVDDFSVLLQPVMEYITKVRVEQHKPVDYVVGCSPDTRLRDAIQLFTKEHVHRIYVLDELKRPIGIVAQTDLMKEISTMARI